MESINIIIQKIWLKNTNTKFLEIVFYKLGLKEADKIIQRQV